ncbi:hypothetical protein BGZ65_010989, partial [Modicella reniformis]
DTISHPLPLSSLPFQEGDPPLKQEEEEDTTTNHRQGNRSLLRAPAATASDHEGIDDSEADGDGDRDGDGDGDGDGDMEGDDEEQHSDADQNEQDNQQRGRVRGGGRGGRGRRRHITKRDPNNEDVEMSLSSDNEDDEESTSIHPNDEEYSNVPEETVCRWKDCGKVLPSIAALVMHLSDEHIGWKKTSYTCEWQGCSRRPIAQTTRFALISHMRSHTKHKPYDCPVPGRKSRGRYTMKDPAASATLLPSSSFGAKKRRHQEPSRSDVEMSSVPKKLRKLGTEFEGDHRHFHPKIPDSQLILQLDAKRRRGGEAGAAVGTATGGGGAVAGGAGGAGGGGGGRQKDRPKNGGYRDQEAHDDGDDDAEDSDFAIDNGQTPRQRYGILKAKFRYISDERESLETEYEELKKKLTRLR